MEKTGKVKKGQNCVIVYLAGNQTSVKIFEPSGKLIRHSRTKGAKKIEQFVDPGEYRVETDGTIERIESVHIDLKAEGDLNQPVNP
ncbi:MAG: hypothetical protein JRD93_08630 [Deltaproteobacteria bacterium]|nr:hypothetical protein [Deltaproteobacteria bacterium]